MVKIEIHDAPARNLIPFPKLMVGKNTGTIYLALNQWFDFSDWLIDTIVIKEMPNGEPIGHKKTYPANILEDFSGSITIRNEQ